MGHFKKILALIILSSNLYSLEISINYGKENSKNFAVLNLKNPIPFLCKEKFDNYGNSSMVECIIDAIPKEGFTPVDTMFFKFHYKMIDSKFHLYIEPKKKEKLFKVPLDIKKNATILDNDSTQAKAYQIVGYEDNIPFLSNQESRGINFPIQINDTQLPYIAELDINNKPLKYSQGADFTAYMNAKSLIKKKSYYNAITLINDTLKKYPNTIFKKDLYLYQMIALSKINQNEQETIIPIALQWIKIYASDSATPKVLYILANSYTELRNYPEANYYYKRIIQEYPDDKFAPLAKMKLAINIYNNGDVGSAIVYFQQAYSEAKDLESASKIAINWANLEIKRDHSNTAIDLIDKVLDAYPQFFTLDSKKTLSTVKFLTLNKLYSSATKIAQYFYDNTKDEKSKQEIAYELGNLYAKEKEYDKAHQANLDFIKNYPKDLRIQNVKTRDDSILFNVSGNNDEKIKRYDYIINKYPNTNESKKATDLKAEVLLEEKHYKEVLDLNPALPKDSRYIQEALNNLIKNNLKANNCKEANIYLIQTTTYDLNDEEKLQAFNCLYNASLNKNAEIISKDMLKNAKTSDQKLQWLYNEAKNLYKLSDYNASILAAKDAFSLAISNKSEKFYDIGFTLFFDLVNTNDKNGAFKIYGELEKLLPDNKKMINVYGKMLDYSQQDKNDTTSEIYAKNLIKLEKQYKSDEFFPYANFILINSLKNTKKLSDALNALQELLANKNLSLEDKQRALYTQGSIQNLENDTNNAKNSFEQCTQIKTDSAWKNLCSQGLDLFKK